MLSQYYKQNSKVVTNRVTNRSIMIPVQYQSSAHPVEQPVSNSLLNADVMLPSISPQPNDGLIYNNVPVIVSVLSLS